MSFSNNKSLRFFIIIFLISISSLNMVLCGAVRFLFYDSTNEMMDNTFWSGFSLVSISIFMLTLLFLFPLEIFYFERKERKGKKLEKFNSNDLLGLPFGVANPDAKIPSFAKYLVLIPLFLLVGLLVILLLGISIANKAKLF